MTYSIHPDKPTSCKDDFPDRLSSFFEQVGGYGEKAEVVQVGLILRIDLSVFQDVGYDPEDQKEVDSHWHSLDTFTSMVDTFIVRVKRNPFCYKKVKYNPHLDKIADEMSRDAQTADTAKLWRRLEQLQKDPLYGYPADHGYLREGWLLKDLQVLKGALGCYKKQGVTKVRLEYM